jgi:hypothetical protein
VRNSSLRALKVGDFEQHVVASPAYLRRAGHPEHPRDLAGHDWIAFGLLRTPLTWTFTAADGSKSTVRMKSRIQVDSSSSLRTLLERGSGVSVLDHYSISDAVRVGRLVRLVADWQIPRAGVYSGFHRASTFRLWCVPSLIRIVHSQGASASETRSWPHTLAGRRGSNRSVCSEADIGARPVVAGSRPTSYRHDRQQPVQKPTTLEVPHQAGSGSHRRRSGHPPMLLGSLASFASKGSGVGPDHQSENQPASSARARSRSRTSMRRSRAMPK